MLILDFRKERECPWSLRTYDFPYTFFGDTAHVGPENKQDFLKCVLTVPKQHQYCYISEKNAAIQTLLVNLVHFNEQLQILLVK